MKFLDCCIFIIATGGIFSSNYTSNNSGDTFHVQWKHEYCSSDSYRQNDSFFQKFKQIVFGDQSVRLNTPIGLSRSESGDLLVTDQNLGTIIRINAENRVFEYLFPPDHRQFPSLISVCHDQGSGIYFTDAARNCVFVYDLQTHELSVCADSLHQPTGIVFSKQTGLLWVAETGRHRLTALDASGRIVRMIGRRGENAAEFNFPNFLHIDRDGVLYVVDSMNFRVQLMSEWGEVLGIIGEPGNKTGYMARPKGIAVDSMGHIYVADALLQTIQVFNRQGTYLYRFGQPGNGPGKFSMPTGIYIGADNRIYVADTYNHRVQEFELSANYRH